MTLARTMDELAGLRAASRRVLAVLAHPDDEAYGCAGALARAGADPDAAAVLLCLTRGEASSMGPARGLTPTEVGRLREGRLVAVAEHLHLAGLLVPGLPDGRLDRLALDEVDAPVRAAIAAFDPHVVITADARGVNGHRDHIAAHWAVRRALAAAPPRRLAMLAYPPEVCEAAKPRLLFATPEQEIDAVVHLAPAEIDAKEAALQTHEALVTLNAEGAQEGLVVRPPVERYDLLGEAHAPPLEDLFAGLSARV
ncbi:MAG: PIG-L family deacetylase [Planctomycetota bacterium]|nr:PIG-L family deacetylase [Planctomycetota bacterium]